MCIGRLGTLEGWWLYQNASELVSFRTYDGGGNSIASAGTVSLNTWSHVAGVSVSATSRYAYLHGSPGPENTGNRSPASVDGIRIACRPDTFNRFTGFVAEFGVWNAALTNAEVAKLARGYSPLLVRPQNLRHYMPFVDGADMDIVGRLKLMPTGAPGLTGHPPIIYPFERRRIVAAPGTAMPMASSIYRRRRSA
jgi:hypothetical protein